MKHNLLYDIIQIILLAIWFIAVLVALVWMIATDATKTKEVTTQEQVVQ